MTTQIFLVRHGETEWSLTGRTDVSLPTNGERRAAQFRGVLQCFKFTQVLTSPRQRARRTCELAGFGVVARAEPDLQEWDYGDHEGRTSVDIRARQPGWKLFEDGSSGGGSVGQISQRADRVLAGLRPMDGTILLFSHGHFLRALAVRWIGLPIQEGRHFALNTASLSILGYEHRNDKTPAISLRNAGFAHKETPTIDSITGVAP